MEFETGSQLLYARSPGHVSIHEVGLRLADPFWKNNRRTGLITGGARRAFTAQTHLSSHRTLQPQVLIGVTTRRAYGMQRLLLAPDCAAVKAGLT